MDDFEVDKGWGKYNSDLKEKNMYHSDQLILTTLGFNTKV